MAEDAAGQPGPIFIFEGFDETRANAGSLGELVYGNFAHLALALQAFTKISPGHEPEPVLDNPIATAKRLTRRAPPVSNTPPPPGGSEGRADTRADYRGRKT